MTPSSTHTPSDHASQSNGWCGRRGFVVALAFIALSFVAAILAINLLNPTHCFIDEGSHAAQIYIYLRGENYIFKDNATFPTYHAVVSSIARVLHWTSVPGLRVASIVLSLCCLVPAISIGRSLHRAHATTALLQFVFLPILFPFFFLLYTDAFALLFVLSSVAMALKNRPVLAGFAAIAAVAVRQNMIVWLTFVFFLLYVREFGWRITLRDALTHARRCWAFIAGAVAFVTFVAINGGIAMGDQQHHPGTSAHLDNIFFSLVIVSALWLPLHIANAKAILTLLRKRSILVLLGLGLSIYLFTFNGEHPYNQVPGFLRNNLIAFMDLSPWHMAAFYPLIALSVLSLAVTEFERSEFALVYVFWFLALLPEGLIEQRYSIPAMAIILLARKPGKPWVEWSLLAGSVAVCAFFLWGIATHQFFL